MGAPNLKLLAPMSAAAEPAPEVAVAESPTGVGADAWRWVLLGCASSLVTLVATSLLLVALQPAAPSATAAMPARPETTPVAKTARAPEANGPVAAPSVARLAAPPPAIREAFAQLWADHPWSALVAAQTAVAEAPQNVDARVAEAFALFELHRDVTALARVRTALSLDPKHPLANLLRGMIAQARHDPHAALAHYDAYLRRRPTGSIAVELSSARQTLSPK